ncbi:nucleotidyl transferase AbiEii/AbiGii toxin family protein [Cryobacterium sp. TMT2-23]|uniref:nucleotidyl transferase AbiEii/AbiGii toxin family protein n=1 Tax=Cryobacterium sp. TMT2-23 TaxID=1259252 RepID=UPI00106A3F7C|nr:hypothetical protein E3T32_00185 [Cryobacterium sp. TMT2-23]
MIASDPYPDGRAVLSAITEKARAAHRSGVGSSVQSLIELAVFDRFLCRVFSQDDCPFALRGGTSMLARLPQSRSTTDVDLETAEMSIDTAIAQLTSATGIDLGDHFECRMSATATPAAPISPSSTPWPSHSAAASLLGNTSRCPYPAGWSPGAHEVLAFKVTSLGGPPGDLVAGL